MYINALGSAGGQAKHKQSSFNASLMYILNNWLYQQLNMQDYEVYNSQKKQNEQRTTKRMNKKDRDRRTTKRMNMKDRDRRRKRDRMRDKENRKVVRKKTRRAEKRKK